MKHREARGPWEWKRAYFDGEPMEPPRWAAKRTIGGGQVKLLALCEVGPVVMELEGKFYPRVAFETRNPTRLHRITLLEMLTLEEAQRAAEGLWDWAEKNLLDEEGNGKP